MKELLSSFEVVGGVSDMMSYWDFKETMQKTANIIDRNHWFEFQKTGDGIILKAKRFVRSDYYEDLSKAYRPFKDLDNGGANSVLLLPVSSSL